MRYTAGMPTRQTTLAEAVIACKALTGRYLAGFEDAGHTAQASALPNHVGWCLGHCALTMNRVAEMIDGRGLPADDFIRGQSHGNQDRFGTESVSYGSSPVDDAAVYPTLQRCVDIFNRACDRLAEAAQAADDATLDKTVTWADSEMPLRRLVLRMVFHNGTHAGQIVDLRRALGIGSIFRG